MRVLRARLLQRLAFLRFDGVTGTLRHESRPRKLRDNFLAFGDAIHGIGNHLANNGGLEVPLGQNFRDFAFMSFQRDDQHALLRLGEQDFVRCHALLAHWNLRDVDGHANIAAFGHLGRRRCEARGPHVLNGYDVALRMSSSDASSSNFSVNGSPTCTRGRLASFSSDSSSDANDAP